MHPLTHTYDSYGTYTVNLTITDSDFAIRNILQETTVSKKSDGIGIPGFELIFAICAITIVLLFTRFTRKRNA